MDSFLICSTCFADNSDQFMQFAIKGNCSLCNAKADIVFRFSDLVPEFESILELYSETKSGKLFIDVLISDFSFFPNVDQHIKSALLVELSKHLGFSHTTKFSLAFNSDGFEYGDSVISREDIGGNENPLYRDGIWTEFVNELRYKNRYFPGINLFFDRKSGVQDPVANALRQCASTRGKQNTFWRARRIEHARPDFTLEEMLMPPPKFARPGRANCSSIPHLYAADSLDTALAEIGVSRNSEAMAVCLSLAENVEIVDFCSIPTLLPPSREEFVTPHLIAARRLLRGFADSLSAPAFDDSGDYIATQYLTEFIKFLGFQGLAWPSSKHAEGVCFAFFGDDYFDSHQPVISRHRIDNIQLNFVSV